MLYIIWAILNIAIFVFFIIICFRATKFIREKFGLISALIFVFGLLSFVTHSTDNISKLESNGSSVQKKWRFISADRIVLNTTQFATLVLEKTMISKYELGISYGVDKDSHSTVPIYGNSWTTGFISGTDWIPTSILISKSEAANQLDYEVNGFIKWKILSATLYTQTKNYKGSLEIQ